jgi:hypothetical protein
MKTPREILLGRHADVNGRLDRIRKQVLTEAFPEPSKTNRKPDSDETAMSLLWRALFAPRRIAWTGLAAAWVVVFVLHGAARSDDTGVVRHESPPSPQVMATLKEQRELLAELVGVNWKAGLAEPRRFEPKPRSEAIGNFNFA